MVPYTPPTIVVKSGGGGAGSFISQNFVPLAIGGVVIVAGVGVWLLVKKISGGGAGGTFKWPWETGPSTPSVPTTPSNVLVGYLPNNTTLKTSTVHVVISDKLQGGWFPGGQPCNSTRVSVIINAETKASQPAEKSVRRGKTEVTE